MDTEIGADGTVMVALLAEGVDRNWMKMGSTVRCRKSPSSRRAWIEINDPPPFGPHCPVALLAEGVDRNPHDGVDQLRAAMSPSSRRAWIEINLLRTAGHRHRVALLAEGVDRN